jgi:hypothetical protein
MKKLSTTKQTLLIALAAAAFGTAVTAPAFAEGWASGPASRNVRPYQQSSTAVSGQIGKKIYALIPAESGYSAYAMVPNDYFNTEQSSLGASDRFGAGSQS